MPYEANFGFRVWGQLKGEGGRKTTNSVYTSVQFSSVAQLCPTLCDPMNRGEAMVNKILSSGALSLEGETDKGRGTSSYHRLMTSHHMWQDPLACWK